MYVRLKVTDSSLLCYLCFRLSNLGMAGSKSELNIKENITIKVR